MCRLYLFKGKASSVMNARVNEFQHCLTRTHRDDLYARTSLNFLLFFNEMDGATKLLNILSLFPTADLNFLLTKATINEVFIFDYFGSKPPI